MVAMTSSSLSTTEFCSTPKNSSPMSHPSSHGTGDGSGGRPKTLSLVHPFQVVLFDIDGTLLRTGGAGVRAFRRTAALWGFPGAMDHVRFHGRTDLSLARQFLDGVGLDSSPKACHRFLHAYTFLLDDELSRFAGELCPGVIELLHGLNSVSNPPLIGLLTGNVCLGAMLKLMPHALDSRFVMGAFGDDHESRDELARIALARAAALLNQSLAGEDILVIGDTPADIQCARAIQAPCLAVATGSYSVAELAAFEPTWVAPNLAD